MNRSASSQYLSEIGKMLSAADFQVSTSGKTRQWELREQLHRYHAATGRPTPPLTGPVFLVDHDWAALCASIEGYAEADFHFPFDSFQVEFSIQAVTIIVSLFDAQGDMPPVGGLFVAKKDGDFLPVTGFYVIDGKVGIDTDHIEPEPWMFRLASIALDQTRAISVLIEADAAETIEINADPKLQRARAKRRVPPINPYLILSLRRSTPAQSAKSAYQGVVRCHFRRGHWMRVGEGKTWRKWTLVGNPDLGFVQKTYVLGGGKSL